MNFIEPINEELEFSLNQNIKFRLSELKTLRDDDEAAFKRTTVMTRGCDILTYKKVLADSIIEHRRRTGEMLKQVYSICGSLLQLGDTVNIDKFSKDDKNATSFSEGYLRCFRDTMVKYKELENKI